MMSVLRGCLVSALMLLGASSAFADTFSSTQYRFSATFPGQVSQDADQDNATDATGKVVSKISTFQDISPGRYMVLVMVDTYLAPVTFTQNDYLPKHVREFGEGIKATPVQTTTTLDGHPAISFSFDMPNQGPGKGYAVFVPGEKPVGYMMIAVRLQNGTAEDQVKLDAFLSSFHIK